MFNGCYYIVHIPQTNMAITRRPAGFPVSAKRNMIGLLNPISHTWSVWQTSLSTFAKCLPVTGTTVVNGPLTYRINQNCSYGQKLWKNLPRTDSRCYRVPYNDLLLPTW